MDQVPPQYLSSVWDYRGITRSTTRGLQGVGVPRGLQGGVTRRLQGGYKRGNVTKSYKGVNGRGV